MFATLVFVLVTAGCLTRATPLHNPRGTTSPSTMMNTRQATDRARTALEGMQEFYNSTSGLWETAGWWQSANSLTSLGDHALARLESEVQYRDIFDNTFRQAQTSGANVVKFRSDRINMDILPRTTSFSPRSLLSQGTHYLSAERRAVMGHTKPNALALAAKRGFAGFINEYYDDEGWWALALLKGHDLGYGPDYINMANSILEDMVKGKSPCGGIFWSKESAYTNAIANELFLAVAASMANRIPSLKDHYLAIALEQWEWFKGSGLINGQMLINDGLYDWNDDQDESRRCKNNGGAIWSYNQGVLVGALVELARATGDNSLIDDWAKPVARAAIQHLTNAAGVLEDPCDPSNMCGGDGAQFKGVFMRNLQYLYKASPEQEFADYMSRQSDSIWTKSRSGNKFGLRWDGPFVEANAVTNDIALDAFVAAAVSS